ncbi:MAG: actin-binding WH2 domain-containing protein [bacterium]|nr:actin-binding WH2 domain-containing protein [bacterium]
MSDETRFYEEGFFEQFERQPRPEFARQLHERLKLEEHVESELIVASESRLIQSEPTDKPAIIHHLSIVESILRTRDEFFAEIREGIGLRQKVASMLVSSAVFLAFSGAVLGAGSQSYPVPQMLSSAFKLPILFLITLIICTPSLYFFNLLFQSRQTIWQAVALIMTAVTTTSVLLVSFAPIMLFFLTAAGDYNFLKLLTVAVYGISGVMGILFLRQGMAASVDADNPDGREARRAIFMGWIVLYAFVGIQMAWTLRPFIGAPNSGFEIIRTGTRTNFYENIIDSATDFFNGD